MTAGRLAVHGHFYQPAREDPFSGLLPPDPSAVPARDWNTRIADESYAPNAERGNFARMGWDLGPTLATWLRRARPELHAAIVAQDAGHHGMAQAYHHAILPLASARDRRTEIRWALRDFELRMGRPATGLWLPETAVDPLTLRLCAEEGVRWTLLAPWQSARPVDTRLPYRVDAGNGRHLIVAFFDAELSASVSFDPSATADADGFVGRHVAPRVATGGTAVIATDGELYGHHQAFRELFLERLLGSAASGHGLEVRSIGAWLDGVSPSDLDPAAIVQRTSWSCHHGVARWSAECACAGDGSWKGPLRQAFDRLAGAMDALTEGRLLAMGVDAWAARDRFVDVASEFAEPDAWAEAELGLAGRTSDAAGRTSDAAGRTSDAARRALLLGLMRAQASRLSMFASDGWFWEDPARPETAQVLRFAAHAVRLVDRACGTDLEARLVEDLAAVRSPHDGPDGAELYVAALEAVGQPAPAATLAAVGQPSSVGEARAAPLASRHPRPHRVLRSRDRSA